MSPLINTVCTNLRTFPTVVGHNLSQENVQHDLAMKLKVYFGIYCEFTTGPPTTQLTSSLFKAIKFVIHRKCIILSAMSGYPHHLKMGTEAGSIDRRFEVGLACQ